jgi:multiple sugar transport system substrate-binding protein
MSKKYYILGGVIVVLLLILAGMFIFGGKNTTNTGQSGQKVELIWWKTFEDQDNLTDLFNDYQKTHKNVTVTFVKKNPADYEKELVDAIASGRTPDIFTIHNDWLLKHIDKLSPMPEKLMTARQYKDIFLDVASSDFVKDNKIYALPMSMDILALYYNKDIFSTAGISSPPKTWPELVIDVEKITVQSSPGEFLKSGIAMGSSSNVNRAVDILLLLMLQNGTKFYSDDMNNAVFDAQINSQGSSFVPGAKALEFYTQFANPAKKSYTWNTKSEFSIDAFTQGKLGMILSYSYLEPILKTRAPNLSWDVAAVPQVDEQSTKVNYANYWGEAVSKFSSKQAVAWDFLNFITKKENLAKYYAKHKLPAARKDMIDAQINDNDIGVFAENSLSAKSVPKKDVAGFEGVFLKMIDDVVLRSFKPEEAIRNAALQINLSLRGK